MNEHYHWSRPLLNSCMWPRPPPDVGQEQDYHIAGNVCGRNFRTFCGWIVFRVCSVTANCICGLSEHSLCWTSIALLLKTDQQSCTNRTLMIHLHLSHHLWFNNRIGNRLCLISNISISLRSIRESQIPSVAVYLWFRFWSSWFIIIQFDSEVRAQHKDAPSDYDQLRTYT